MRVSGADDLSELKKEVEHFIRPVPDFPKPGILFRDITPLLQTPAVMAKTISWFADFARQESATKIVAVESRGFLFGAAVCERLGLPLVLARKAGKLPYETISKSYALEYGQATLQMHIDALTRDDRVVVVDDVLATGGTAGAVKSLIDELGARYIGAQFLIELTGLRGRDSLSGRVESLVCYG